MDETATWTDALPGAEPSATRVRVLRRVHPPPLTPDDTLFLHGQTVVAGREGGPRRLHIDQRACSRRHAEFAFDHGLQTYAVRDLGSRNGTRVDGARVERRRLIPGAVVGIGPALFVYTEADFPPEQAPLTLEPTVALARERVRRRVDVLATTRLPLLIRGPSGAGKERLAQRIHDGSGRAGPLVAVNCAALSPELAGSALFGHVKGAFTGAGRVRAGHLVSADGGTLFLDEIADLPPALQPLLLRAIQEGRVRPVGADAEVAVDVRLVAASHRDLGEAVAAGTFRGDLFERLRGATIALPPLAERRDEILSLFGAFVGQRALAGPAAEALLLYDWPGNVRELRHAAEEALAFAGDTIELHHLPARVRAGARPAEAAPSGKPSIEQLIALLETHRGRVNRVAEALGVQRTQVYRWVKAAGIDLERFRG